MHLRPEEIARLSRDERLALIAALWDSLEDEDVPLTSAQKGELERRLAMLDGDTAEGVSWYILREELERRAP